MEPLIINFVAIFLAVIGCQLSPVYSDPLLSQEESFREPLQLSKFITVDLFVPPTCSRNCSIQYDQTAVASNICRDGVTDLAAATCEDSWILNWDRSDLGEGSDEKTCKSAISKFDDNYECPTCGCIVTNVEYSMSLRDTMGIVAAFSLAKQESDTKNNMVVTGLRFAVENSVMHVQIQEAKLMSDGAVTEEKTWKQLAGVEDIFNVSTMIYSFEENFGDNYVILRHDKRTIFLDEIYIPDKYVITGVRFVEIDHEGGHQGIKIQVKGTKYDSSYRLRRTTDRWFDYEDNLTVADSYERTRTEIPLNNCTDPNLATDNMEIPDTNRFIRFRATDIKKDLGQRIIPYFSGESAEGFGALRGIAISYKGQQGFGGFIIPKVYPL